MTADAARAFDAAQAMGVICCGCGMFARPERVLGVVISPQHNQVAPYAIVAFRCSTPDCGEAIPCEVDL